MIQAAIPSVTTTPSLNINGDCGGPRKKKKEVNRREIVRYKSPKCMIFEGFLLSKR